MSDGLGGGLGIASAAFFCRKLRSSLSNILTQKVALGSTVNLGKEKT